MGEKGTKTKQLICTAAYRLFCEKGYKDVTMKDICEETGLSRGGLYRHYKSTEQIFLVIIHTLMENQTNEFEEQIQKNVPAREILNRTLLRYEKEMMDAPHSLSVAMFEFFSNPEIAGGPNSVSRQYQSSLNMWEAFIEYGMKRKEFRTVEPAAVIDLILFSYQGVRMYSKLAPVDPAVPRRITEQIRHLLLAEREE